MEKAGSWNRKSVINELTQGIELANELKKQLHPSTNSREACGFLVEKIVSCYDNALALLNCMALLGNGDSTQLAAVSNIQVSPTSGSEVSNQDSKDQVYEDVHKKKKTLPRWSEQVHVWSGTGLEGQLDDGYNWRKYGQKDILGANHPRAYYRCTHRNTQGCLATKQVQRMDDPSIFDVVYRGKHSCIQERNKQNKENVNVKMEEEESQRLSQQMMISIEPGLKVETQELVPEDGNFPSVSFPSTPIESENVETQLFLETSNFVGASYSPPFLSPAMSESYFSMSPRQGKDFGIGHNFLSSESYFTEMISDPTSDTNFPLGHLDFLIDQVDFDSHFLDTADNF
ncbi:hypothetical protein Pfo_005920 [Paulownia fortunei]|nr:hypothetical protein Pfo_005920 [Paulownia fortunei]